MFSSLLKFIGIYYFDSIYLNVSFIWFIFVLVFQLNYFYKTHSLCSESKRLLCVSSSNEDILSTLWWFHDNNIVNISLKKPCSTEKLL